MAENAEGVPHYTYTSKPNELGINGYNLLADPELAKRFPMPSSQVQPFFESFCNQRDVRPSDIPLVVTLPKYDDEDMHSLVTVAVTMVFEAYGYKLEDTKDLSVISPKGAIVAPLKDGTQRMLIEYYEEDKKVIYIANRLFYDDDIRKQLEGYYNIPTDVSEDYLMVYLTAHSTVHHIQNLQQRMGKNPEGYKDNPGGFVKEVLELETEKEAHNVGIRVADEIWLATVGQSEPGDK